MNALERVEAPPPRVSVVMATYNRRAVLPYSIGSVLSQSFADFELLVVGDGRADSPTHRTVREVRCGDVRPTFVVIPVGVWHGVQNLGTGDALMINFPTIAYDYADPDHYRLPWDTPEIPYQWTPAASAPRLRNDR